MLKKVLRDATKAETREMLKRNSFLVALDLDFPDSFDAGDVLSLLQCLGAHMEHLKLSCSSKAQCQAVVQVIEGCPREYLRTVSLLETGGLKDEELKEFLNLSVCNLDTLQVLKFPRESLAVFCGLAQKFPALRVQSPPAITLPPRQPLPKFELREPLPVSQLPKGQWGFIASDPTSFPPWTPIGVPVDANANCAKDHSQLLARLVGTDTAGGTGIGADTDPQQQHTSSGGNGDEPFVFNTSLLTLTVLSVQLLVAYIENTPPFLPPQLSMPECTGTGSRKRARDDANDGISSEAKQSSSGTDSNGQQPSTSQGEDGEPAPADAADWELMYSTSVRDEHFLQLVEEYCGHAEHTYTINTTVVDLLRAGNYLQIPSLRRLMRSFIIRRDIQQNSSGGGKA